MNPFSSTATLALAAAALSAASVATAQAPPRSPLPLPDAATIAERCDAAVAEVRAMRSRMEQGKGKGTVEGGVLAEFNALALKGDGFFNPVYLLANVSPDKATRDAAQACVEKFTPLSTEVYQSPALLRRVRALKPTDPVDRVYWQDLLDGFQDAGAALAPARRARAKVIQDELGVLGLAFQKAVNEDPTTVTITPDEAAGMPEAWLAAQKRDGAGNLVLRLDYPTYIPFLQNATQEEPRRKVWTAYQNRGGKANLERLDTALRLRHELARLHGFPDYATFAMRRRMAETPRAVQDFLDRVRNTVLDNEKTELAELRAEKAAFTGQPLEAVTVRRWDVSLLQERIKRARFSIDQERLRANFPTAQSVQFAIRLAERLYGIEFVAAPDVPVWHPDVRYHDVYERGSDGRRGEFIGGAYLDLFPREGKYSHAAAFPVVPVSRLAGQKPVSVLVTNFNPKGLDHDELETLLHEFGHVLHGVLSTTRYADQAGTSVKRDFVEAPSQMFEEWARRPETLSVLAEVCPECPRLSPEQLQQLDAARKFGRGIRYGRQWQYATYDLRLHTGAPKSSLATWVELERSMPLGYVEGTLFPAGFGHVMGGYAAGYYGYMWSEVMALDMLSAFQGRLMDPAIGRRYRETILSQGGEQPPLRMVERFLGRKPTPDAFFAEITGRR